MNNSKIQYFVFCWDRVLDNVKNIESTLVNNSLSYEVINSCSSYQDKNWINVGNDFWFTSQVYEAFKNFNEDYEYICLICGDLTHPNWNEVFKRSEDITNKNLNFWIYAPEFTFNHWDKQKTMIKHQDDNLIQATMTDCLYTVIHKDVVKILLNYLDYLNTKKSLNSIYSGWGIDIIWCALAIKQKKMILRDLQVLIGHEENTGYDANNAVKEMEYILLEFVKYYPEQIKEIIEDIINLRNKKIETNYYE